MEFRGFRENQRATDTFSALCAMNGVTFLKGTLDFDSMPENPVVEPKDDYLPATSLVRNSRGRFRPKPSAAPVESAVAPAESAVASAD